MLTNLYDISEALLLLDAKCGMFALLKYLHHRN